MPNDEELEAVASSENAIRQTAAEISRAGRVPSPLSSGFFAGVVLLADVAGILATGLMVHGLYVSGFMADLSQTLAIGLLFTLLAVLGMNSAGLYRFNAIVDPKRQILRLATILGGVFLVLTAAGFALKISGDYSRVWAFAWLASAICIVVLGRMAVAAFIRSLARSGRLGRRILIYGATDQARKLIERIERLEEPWNHIVGIFDDRLARVGPTFGRYSVMGNLQDLIAWGRVHTLDEVLVALPWGAEDRLRAVMGSLSVLPANVRLCPELFVEEMLQARTSHQFGVPMWNAFEKPLAGWDAIGKRVFDLLFSAAVLVFAAPLFFLIAALIKLESPGPVLFRQNRYGFNNEVIEVWKFRSMSHAEADAAGVRLTERNDPRVTRLGRFMRRSSLDELPQIINVLRGEMSIVGPRPHALRTTAGGRLCEDVVDRYSIRHKVKPGITGWAQVNGFRGTMEDEEHLRQRVEHDLYYVNNWSPWLDVKIIAMTAWIVVHGRNSY